MIISEQWLREFVDIPCSPAELADILTMLGLEVEKIEYPARKFNRFIVGYVLERIQHPNADKLSVCTVQTGEPEPRTIICGAPNVAAGQHVAVALDGAIVPAGGFEIGKRKLRGVESNGMICSQAELELGEDTGGIWVLENAPAVGTPLADYLGVNDVLYEIGITPNRADCLSHLGIAREIAAYFGLPLRKPEFPESLVQGSIPQNRINVFIESPDHCPRYAGKIVQHVTIKPSPEWMQKRLTACGMRPKNCIVDITNYILLECGHPLHAFDYDTIAEATIRVKTASEGEKFVTLDGKERQLDSSMLMICDNAKPVAVAGVMGGENSEISDSTTTVFIESAMFTPSSIRRTAKQLDIKSEASYRFERGTDDGNILYAVARAAQLMAEIAGGEIVDGITDVIAVPYQPAVVTLRFERIEAILGVAIPKQQVIDIVKKLYCTIVEETENAIIVQIPSFRVDIAQEIDMIEEVARLYHYDNIPASTSATMAFSAANIPQQNTYNALLLQINNFLIPRGFQEILTHNFTDPASATIFTQKPVRLANPLGEEMSCLRPEVAIGMLRTIEHNIRHGNKNLMLFEIGKSFLQDVAEDSTVTAFREKWQAVIGLTGIVPEHWSSQTRKVDFYDAKGVAEDILAHVGVEGFSWKQDIAHPLFGGNSIAAESQGNNVLFVGEARLATLQHFGIEQPVMIIVIDADNLANATLRKAAYSGISPFPTVERDIAFVVDENLVAAELLQIISSSGGEYLRSVDVFDVYKGKNLPEGKKSLAFRLRYNAIDKTLQDSDVEASVKRILKKAQQQVQAELRA